MRRGTVVLLLATALSAAEKRPEVGPISPPVAMTARVVRYNSRDIVAVAARVGFTTMLELPATEKVMLAVCGDKGRWVVDGPPEGRFVFVKPTEAGTSTNLNVITAAGNVYSLVLHESSGEPDMRIVLEPVDVGYVGAAEASPKYVPASAVADYQAQVEIAHDRVRRMEDAATQQAAEATKRAEADKAAALRQYPARVRTDYQFKASDAVFKVSSIYRDDNFTYIRANPAEAPAVYEIKDDKPALIQFTFRDGLYTLDHIVTNGYLAVGKRKLYFYERQ